MKTLQLPVGTVHDSIPVEFEEALLKNEVALNLWQDITPLARNEWICWLTAPKKQETRVKHVEVGISKLTAGERRPCCWAGCWHREKNGA